MNSDVAVIYGELMHICSDENTGRGDGDGGCGQMPPIDGKRPSEQKLSFGDPDSQLLAGDLMIGSCQILAVNIGKQLLYVTPGDSL